MWLGVTILGQYSLSMNITLWVPYDKQRLRTQIKFLMRPTTITLRIVGAAASVIGVVMLLTDYTSIMSGSYPLVFGVFLLVISGSVLTSSALRGLGPLARLGYQLTLDDAGMAVKSELVDTRFPWQAIGSIVERPEAWYLLLARNQGQAVFKDLMTEEQRAEFAAFVAQRQPV
jgi:hypothetical protein